MTDKLIAIVRFKHLPDTNPDQRFEARYVKNGLCGPDGRETDCAFFFTERCKKVKCPPNVYFREVES